MSPGVEVRKEDFGILSSFEKGTYLVLSRKNNGFLESGSVEDVLASNLEQTIKNLSSAIYDLSEEARKDPKDMDVSVALAHQTNALMGLYRLYNDVKKSSKSKENDFIVVKLEKYGFGGEFGEKTRAYLDMVLETLSQKLGSKKDELYSTPLLVGFHTTGESTVAVFREHVDIYEIEPSEEEKKKDLMNYADEYSKPVFLLVPSSQGSFDAYKIPNSNVSIVIRITGTNGRELTTEDMRGNEYALAVVDVK